MSLVAEALGVDLVDVLGARRPRGEPAVGRRHLDAADGRAVGGIKVTTANGWFAARPSGTEDIYKVYAESFRDDAHLKVLLEEAQDIVNKSLAS